MKQGYNIMNSQGVKVDYVEIKADTQEGIKQELSIVLHKYYPTSHYTVEVGTVKN